MLRVGGGIYTFTHEWLLRVYIFATPRMNQNYHELSKIPLYRELFNPKKGQK